MYPDTRNRMSLLNAERVHSTHRATPLTSSARQLSQSSLLALCAKRPLRLLERHVRPHFLRRRTALVPHASHISTLALSESQDNSSTLGATLSQIANVSTCDAMRTRRRELSKAAHDSLRTSSHVWKAGPPKSSSSSNPFGGF